MTDNAGCVFSEMMEGGWGGNAASYKDKKSVPAFFPSSFFSPFLIGLHLGGVIRHSAHSTESHTTK